MQQLNRLLLRQAQKYLGGAENIPENYMAFITAISEAYDHYEKDRHMLERSIELSSEEMIQLNSKLTWETEELKKAHNDLKNTEHVRLEKRLDEEKIKNLQEITEAVIEAQERERSFLAGELHENINQILATSRIYIDTAIHNEHMRLNLIRESKGFVNTAMEEIRYLCKSLLPPSLAQTTLVNTLDDMIRNINKVNKIQVKTSWENIDESQMSEKLKLNIFRIIQEQLNNTFKHAKATNVVIRLLKTDDGFQLTIKDDGVGFDTSQKRNGIGLQNIISRSNLFNGEVVVNSKPGSGCELIVAFHKQAEEIQHKKAS